MVTAPSEKDFKDEKIGPYIQKYLKGVDSVSTENRLRILRLLRIWRWELPLWATAQKASTALARPRLSGS